MKIIRFTLQILQVVKQEEIINQIALELGNLEKANDTNIASVVQQDSTCLMALGEALMQHGYLKINEKS